MSYWERYLPIAFLTITAFLAMLPLSCFVKSVLCGGALLRPRSTAGTPWPFGLHHSLIQIAYATQPIAWIRGCNIAAELL